jgi:hypothetical protein
VADILNSKVRARDSVGITPEKAKAANGVKGGGHEQEEENEHCASVGDTQAGCMESTVLSAERAVCPGVASSCFARATRRRS